jgi:hypothetical protein
MEVKSQADRLREARYGPDPEAVAAGPQPPPDGGGPPLAD